MKGDKVLLGEVEGTFMDRNCVLEFQGREFESGGAFIGQNKQGKLGGVMYVCEKEKAVMNWHGTIKIPARFGRVWKSNMGDRRRAVYFQYAGRRFFGMWSNMDFNMSVRVRQVK